MTGCEIVKCKHYKNGKCNDPTDYVNEFGKGKGIYLGGFSYNNANTRMLLNLLLYGTGLSLAQKYIPDNCDAECAYYPQSKEIIVINNSDKQIETHIMTATGVKNFTLEAYEMQIEREYL